MTQSHEPYTRYAVVLTPDPESEGFSVMVPSLPGVFTHGATIDESLVMARDAIACFLDLSEEAGSIAKDRVEAILATVAVVNH
jgi:predicted RNase H-like HicB family nuclease